MTPPSLAFLARSYAIAAGAALLLALPLALVLQATLALPDGFLPTAPLAVVLTILVSFAAATAAFALLARWRKDPRRDFVALGAVLYVLSLGGPLSGGLEAQFPGSGTSGALAAAIMHTAAAVPALALIGRARAR